ncbi:MULTISPECIES: cyclophane-containing RiPP N-acetyltransferase HaaN [unclassified Streptomyces]|uniref:cyclophane-containing RiPP N-acetyltransferase HaaN n=1 Tax=unclassified Streptomyces TaxID=2593676 RepID=UPI0006FC933C|nr:MULTISPECIES: cyclophane-containing RiPP N-acetyltransferase HaaN [unclassified Streptomyces]KQX51504.1 GCN5 family acetyltransferase [Streptomyces sp. Root1304]KRA85923.1 GCN5 family acetyltransferase [Streptomyces sp. Root66D1]
MTVTIRPAEQRDVHAVAELIEEIERFYGSTGIQPFEERRAQVEEALFGAPPLASALLVEGEAGDIVGLAAYSFLWPAAGSTHSLFLKELYVRDTLRRQGIGARLMDELRALAAARPGCGRVEWMTDHDNPAARAFYKSLGFAEFDGKIIYRVEVGVPRVTVGGQ